MKKLILFIIVLNIVCGNILAQTFTRITEGDIVNDGGFNYGAAWGDYDNDGFIDLFVANNDSDNKNNFLYHNNNDGTFTKITDGAIVTDGGSSYGCSWGDYNNDGYLDLFVSNYNENNFLYSNNGDGTFSRITEGSIVNDGGSSAGCSWGDYDNDGYLDLFVANRTQSNFLYHNNEDGTFTKITSGVIVTDNANSSSGSWADYDGDNDADLFVANAGPAANFLYRNNGNGTFTKITEGAIVTDVSHSNGGSWGDYDNDGDLDLFVPSGVIGSGFNYLYRNNGDGTFTSVTGDPIVEVFHWAGGSSWGDFDNDGDLDMFVGGYDGNNLLYANDGTGSFALIDTGVVVTEGNYSMGAIWGDYDNDGDIDLFIAKNNYFGGNNALFRNESSDNNWLKVKCIGTISNSAGIGANVSVYATINDTSIAQLREISGQTGGGNSGQNSINASFGLGDATVIDSIKIEWTSGTIEVFTDIAVNQFITITEGEGTTSIYVQGNRLIEKFELAQNYPNPFNPKTVINYSIPQAGFVLLRIYDILGNEITTLVDEYKTAGNYFIEFDGSNFSSGIYFYRMQTGNFSNTKKLILMK